MHEFLGWEANVKDKQYHSPTDDDDRAVLPGTLASIWCIGSGLTPSNRVGIIAALGGPKSRFPTGFKSKSFGVSFSKQKNKIQFSCPKNFRPDLIVSYSLVREYCICLGAHV